ncbi:acetylcholine receptor subunit alpha-like [Haliotis cracherodii]|uniref:acetylcholine receptor subunit alpha-like n=1 Tax=Haliotis cracherodii TaxID=6455 RepID=UPI0039EA3D43
MRQITKCSIDMSKFPMDTQTCSLRLIQWLSDNNEVFLQGGSVMSNYNIFQSEGEWREIEKTIKTITYIFGEGLSQNEISFTFTFQRKPLHFVITSVLPVLLLSVLNLGVFLLPPESGEKISLCISVFLSYALILTDINEVLPQSPDSLAIFNVYLLAMLLVKVITTLATVATLKRYHAEIRTQQLSSSSSQKGRVGNNSMLDECNSSKGRCYVRKMSSDALNGVFFSVISFIMIASTSVCLALLLL